MAKPGEYDFVPLIGREWSNTVSLGIFQWIYRADGHGLKKSKIVYRIKGPAYEWQKINARAKYLCEQWNWAKFDLDGMQYKKSETI